jgi:hypothetical protein
MRKKIKDTILIEELNGEEIGTWINALVQLRDDIGDLATISVCADDDQFFQKTEVSIYATFERIETDDDHD